MTALNACLAACNLVAACKMVASQCVSCAKADVYLAHGDVADWLSSGTEDWGLDEI